MCISLEAYSNLSFAYTVSDLIYANFFKNLLLLVYKMYKCLEAYWITWKANKTNKCILPTWCPNTLLNVWHIRPYIILTACPFYRWGNWSNFSQIIQWLRDRAKTGNQTIWFWNPWFYSSLHQAITKCLLFTSSMKLNSISK